MSNSRKRAKLRAVRQAARYRIISAVNETVHKGKLDPRVMDLFIVHGKRPEQYVDRDDVAASVHGFVCAIEANKKRSPRLMRAIRRHNRLRKLRESRLAAVA